ncbi:MFS transporter [Acidaminobacter sp. JC074]|uniref:MFS transporter n=1 Tax=Acidaminobacter sp. JC074 TaxID=2530199 RepID=UPI001F0EC27C|nr:MFS transporter [Acidaminobacter sp. JC074]
MKKEHKYLSWGILVFGFVIVFFHRLAIGSVSDFLISDLKLDSVQIANLTAMTFYGYALMQLPVGIMVDTIGVRKLCTAGMAITALGSILFGLSDVIALSYLARLMVGIGTATIIVSIMKLQATLFPANMYSTLSGLTSLFGNFGAFFATIPLTYLALNLGWRQTFIILGILTGFLSIAIYVFVREGHDTYKREKINVKEAVKFVLTNKKVYPDFFIMVFFVGSLTAVLGLWGNGYMKNVYHITNEKAAYYLSFITYGFIVGAPIVGKLSDYLGGEIKKILLFASGGYLTIWAYVLLIYKGQPPIGQWPVIFFIMGILIICHILVFSNVKEVNPLKYTGIAISIVNIGEFVGSGLISLSMGYLIKRLSLTNMLAEEVYKTAMILVLVSAVLSFISVICMHGKKERLEDETGRVTG